MGTQATAIAANDELYLLGESSIDFAHFFPSFWILVGVVADILSKCSQIWDRKHSGYALLPVTLVYKVFA